MKSFAFIFLEDRHERQTKFQKSIPRRRSRISVRGPSRECGFNPWGDRKPKRKILSKNKALMLSVSLPKGRGFEKKNLVVRGLGPFSLLDPPLIPFMPCTGITWVFLSQYECVFLNLCFSTQRVATCVATDGRMRRCHLFEWLGRVLELSAHAAGVLTPSPSGFPDASCVQPTYPGADKSENIFADKHGAFEHTACSSRRHKGHESVFGWEL